MTKPRSDCYWSAREDEMLASLAGDMPITMLVNTYNQWASVNKYRKRTRNGILCRASFLGVSLEVCGTWIARGILMRALGNRIQKWADLETKKIGRYTYVKRSDLRAFARKHPERFAGLSVADLVMVLDSVPLAEQLAAQGNRPRSGYPRKVVCKETGKIYPSAADAGRAHFVHSTSVIRSIRTGRPCICGRSFAYSC